MAFINYRDQSRNGNWGHTSDKDALTIEQINCGSLLRIADASELMAKNFLDLQNKLKYMTAERNEFKKAFDRYVRKNRSLKGAFTKYKAKHP